MDDEAHGRRRRLRRSITPPSMKNASVLHFAPQGTAVPRSTSTFSVGQGGKAKGKGKGDAGSDDEPMDPRDRALWACAAASVIVRRASRLAFRAHRRSMTAPDAIGAR